MKSLLTLVKKLRHLWVLLYFTAATVFMTYPVAFQLSTSTLGGTGDNIYFVWLIRWYQQVLLEGKGRLFFNAWMNYPQGWNLSTTDTTLASALPGVPFSALWGPVAGYNIAMLLTFVLSGYFMYLWVRSLTRSEGAALFAGTLYAFLPYRMAHFISGHLNLSGTQWFPLYFMGLYSLLKAEKRDWKAVLLTAFSLGLIGFTSMYYLYMTLLLSVVLVIGYLLLAKFKPLRSKTFWINVLLTVALSLPLVLASLKPFLDLSDSGGLASRSAEYASMYSASPTDYFLPSSDHFLFGGPLSQVFDRSLWMESSLYISLTGLVLCLAALIWNKRSEHRKFIWAALLVILSAVILSFGINLHWNNQTVVWQIPEFLQPLLHRTETQIPLPANWLFLHLPFFDKMRALMRFGLFALIFTTVLAGIGLDLLLKKFTRRGQILLTAGCILLVLFEFYPGSYTSQLTQPQPRAVDLWLAEQPDGALVQMPFSESVDQVQLYYTLTSKKAFVGGFFNANQPAQYQAVRPILDQFPSHDSIITLRDLEVKYIVIDQAAYEDWTKIEAQLENESLVLLKTLDGQAVYTLPNP